MRGVIALAAAISLPQSLADGSPFPQRSLIIVLTFSVILVTLVVQGLTLPTVIRVLGLGGAEDAERSTREARRLVIEAALAHLRRIRGASPEFADVDGDIAQHYEARVASLQSGQAEPDRQQVRWQARYLDVSRQLLNIEPETALRLRREGRISSEALQGNPEGS
jgi:CPA1 family monovalent cation:H+ antiporter